MAKALIIGAGEFGRELIGELARQGVEVDVLDKEPSVCCEQLHQTGQFFCNNAMNIASMPNLMVAQYDYCIISFRAESWVLLHIVRALHRAGARSIMVRVERRHQSDENALRAAGASRLINVERLAGGSLADTLTAG